MGIALHGISQGDVLAGLSVPGKRIIHTGSPESTGETLVVNNVGIASGPWLSANKPVATPFIVREADTITHLAVRNGSAAGESVDLGVYDLSWAKIVTTGSQTPVTASGWDVFDVTDTPIAPGRYYQVTVRDNVTANRQAFVSHTASALMCSAFGMQESATNQFPLGTTLTDMAPTTVATRFPMWSVLFRAVFA